MRRKAQGVPVLQGSFQQRLPVPEAEGRGAIALEVEKVEDVVKDGHRTAPRLVRITNAEALLQPLEAGPPALEGHDFPVYDKVGGAVPGQAVDDLGIGVVEALLASREQTHLSVLPESQAPFPVQLALEDPRRVGEVPVGESGQHRRHPVRWWRRPQPRPGVAAKAVERSHQTGLPGFSLTRKPSARKRTVAAVPDRLS